MVLVWPDILPTKLVICQRLIRNAEWTLQLHHHFQCSKSCVFSRFQMLHQFYAMQSPQMLKHSHINTKFRESYTGALVFIQVPCVPFGQHQGLVNVPSFLPVHQVLFYLRWSFPNSTSCTHTKCCELELVLFRIRNPLFLTHQSRHPSIMVHLTTS